jgi:hypothetical protein
MITTETAIKTYGFPTKNPNYLTTIKLPFPLILSWDKNVSIDRMTCHKLVADKLLAIFNDLLAHYGKEKIHELGIDRYGGCYNFRKMRGGSDYSRHSWGIAIDLDPERNLLKETSKTARFARPEYKEMIDIFYKHGFESLGREKNYDWMHFQIKG